MNRTLSKAVLTIILSLAAASANAEYTFRLLDGLGGTKSSAMGINSNGQVVGYAYSTNNENFYATIWNGSNVSSLSANLPNTVALDINNSGQVAGYVSLTGPNGGGDTPINNPSNALSWNAGNVSSPPSLGGTYNKNKAVNDSGTSVGWSLMSGDNNYHATVWSGRYTIDLGAGASGGLSSRAVAINDSGLVVGSSLTSDGVTFKATLWDGLNATDLGTLGGAGSLARSINASGQIVGQSDTALGSEHATLWDNGVVTDLGTLSGFYDYSYANGINTSGQIVGWSGGRAALWSNGTITDLNSFLDVTAVNAGWVLNGARAINDNGWVVGQASNALLGISSQAFLLAPVPEADTSAMLLMGAGLMGFMARRRKQVAA
jgi:probable HAF family extracellular repeat protein